MLALLAANTGVLQNKEDEAVKKRFKDFLGALWLRLARKEQGFDVGGDLLDESQLLLERHIRVV